MTTTRPNRAHSLLPRALSGVLGAALAVGSLAGGVLTATSAHADNGLTVTPTGTVRVTPGTTGAITGMSISGDTTHTLQATVATDNGTVTITPTGTDALAYGNAWSGTTSLTFTGSQADLNTALAGATLTVPAGDGIAHVSLTVMVATPGINYLSSNQHFYQYVSSAGSTWLNADANAKLLSFAGQRGYLATIPNSTVDDFISNKISGATNVWFGARSYEAGATDGTAPLATVNGTSYARVWRWAVGDDESPINGSVISECTNQAATCSYTNRASLYDSWASGEPNNYNISTGAAPYSGEWAAVTNWSGTLGKWNDLPSSTTGISGYVVEYGGNTNTDPSLGTGFSGVVTATGAVTLANAPTAPSAPVLTVTPGDSSATVSWNPPADGGSAITGYEYSTDGTNWSPLSTTSSSTVVSGNVVTTVSGTISGLVNGTQSNILVRADNSAGSGTSSAVSTVTPFTVPSSPTPASIAAGNFSIAVTWTPTFDGGRPVTSYTAEAGGHSCTTSGNGCTITGLADGTAYTVDVYATNAAGSGLHASWVDQATPSAPNLTPSGTVTSNQPQQATAPFPAGGSVTLLDGQGNPVTTVTSVQGSYTIDTTTGVITFTPALGYVGTPDPVTYRSSDGSSSGTATFAPSAVMAPNGPTAVPLTPSSTPVTNHPQSATPSVPFGDTVTLLDAQQNSVTSVTVTGGTYTLTNGVITFTPDLGWTGTPTPVGYELTDPYGQSSSSTFSPGAVIAPAPPTAPALSPSSPAVANQPQVATAPVPPNGSITLIDGNGDPATTVVVPSQGAYVLDPATGDITFTPELGFTGTPDPVTYEVTDAYGHSTDSSYQPYTVTAPAAPAAPPATPAGAGDQPQHVTVDVPAGGSVTLIDGNGHPATTVVVDGEGTYTLNPATDVVTFTPAPGYHGTPDPAPYQVTDAYGQKATGTVAPAAVTIAPTAPSITEVAVGDGKVTLTIGAPASDGGQPVTSYTVVVGPTGQRIAVPSTGTVVVDDLTNGAGYTFTVVATNAVGTSAASAPASATPVAAGAPGLKNPRIGNHKLWLTVVPPASTGTPIVGYTVTLAPGGATSYLSGAAGGQVLLTGLVNGRKYTATVESEYATLAGPVGASMAATPMTVPSAPKFHVRRTPTRLALKLVAPKNNGGGVVKSYRVVISGPGLKKPRTFTVSPKKKKLTVYGLRPSTRYKVTISAVNAAGRSKAFRAYVRTKKAPKAGLSIADLVGHPFASGVTVNLGADAAFATGSSVLTARAVRQLTALAHAAKGHKAITCSGYSDFGATAADAQLALDRATAVCAFLKAHGAAVRTTVVSYGGARPLVITGNGKARAVNRRVTITFA